MYRLYHAMRIKSGLIRRQVPATTWGQQPLSAFLSDPSQAEVEKYAALRQSSARRFFFDPQRKAQFKPCFAKWDSSESSPEQIADDLGQGFIEFFSHERVDVGFPPRWHADPFSGDAFPTDRHWSQIGDFGAGDVKLVWETNRFAFVFPLVRAYWRTGLEQYAELFWQLVESWSVENPPQLGVNWKCGQEISLRVMAWSFGLYGFASSPASTPSRVALLAQMMAVSGRRIEANIGYALSQRNNHGLSEATGLWTIGALFPEFADAARWGAKGRRLLESQARSLIYRDGAFSQHSMNYHRVMLQDYLWSMRLGDVLDQPFSNRLRDRIAAAGEFVYQLQDESTGQVPCYGHDDGALILPLNNCAYRDYRPVVQATSFLTTGKPRLDSGPWDEDLFWLFGVTESSTRSTLTPSAPAAIPTSIMRTSSATTTRETATSLRTDFEAPEGGYTTLRSSTGFALTRAARFRHRPAQADLLHVDIWWQGENVAIDPGTYSYNAPFPWNNSLAQTSHHNTVTVDGLNQMQRAGRFLWLPWSKGKSFSRNVPHQGDVACWNGEHDGYRRLSDPVTHRRGLVRLGAEHWLVIDSLQGLKPHSFRLHWLLLDAPYEVDFAENSLELQTAVGRYRVALAAVGSTSRCEVVRADNESARGWSSPFYHARQPAISVSLETTATKMVFATVLGPDAETPTVDNNVVHLQGPDWTASAALNLTRDRGVALIRSIDVDGSLLSSTRSITHRSFESITESHQCTSC